MNGLTNNNKYTVYTKDLFLDFGNLSRFQLVSSHVAPVPVARLVRRLKQVPAHLWNMQWCNLCKIVGRASR